ncbi:MAG: trimethylamine methyltransferase family protein [Phycisphaerae bacterium]|nr:trimethylamine methyltransferase family protein [Phycisphaerae bacterium]
MKDTKEVRPHLVEILSQDDLDRMHAAALEIIEEVGIRVSNSELLKRFAERAEGRVRIDGDIVRFERSMVEEYLADYKKEQKQERLEKTDRLLGVTGAHANSIVDLDTGEIRPITSSDLVEMAKLIDSMHESGIFGSAPGYPQDVPAHLQPIAQYKIGCENSRTAGPSPRNTLEQTKYIYEIAQLMEHEFSIAAIPNPVRISPYLGHHFDAGFLVISPLTLGGSGVDIAVHFLDRQVRIEMAGGPMAGATGPIFIPAVFVQEIAETIAAYMVFKTVAKGNVNFYIGGCALFDMSSGTAISGCPENLLMGLLHVEVNRYYGNDLQKVFFAGMECGSMEPGEQAACEKSLSVAMLALAGVRIVGCAGVLGMDEIFSPEQLVIDAEMIGYINRLLEGFEFSDKTLAVEAIKEVGPGGNYLMHDTTLENFRNLLWMPTLFNRQMYKTWKTKDGKTIRDKAKAKARELIAKHDFELPGDVRKELDRIYEHAQKTLG